MMNTLFALIITTLIISSLGSIILIPKHILKTDSEADVFAAIKDISSYTLATDILVKDNSITFNDNMIYLDNDRIVKTPGYETILCNVDTLHFEVDNQLVYITIKRKNKTYRSVINYLIEEEEC